MCADTQTHTHMHRHHDLQPGSFPSLHCRKGCYYESSSSLSPLSQTHCSPVTHTDVKTNTQINSQKQTHTRKHSHTRSTETWATPPLFSILPSKSSVPHIATNISHELSATSPSWIFIKQNSKQIDFTPAALLHFYLILSLSQMLTCSSLPLPQFHRSILSPLLSFLTLILLPLCISCLFYPLSLFFTLSSPLSHSLSSAFHSLHFLKPHFPASPDLCSWICGPEEGCCWWVDELCFDFVCVCLWVCLRVHTQMCELVKMHPYFMYFSHWL